MNPSAPGTDPMFDKVDSLVRDGTLTPGQAGSVYARMREGGPTAGATSVIPADGDRRRWTLPLRAAAGAAILGASILLGALLVANDLAEQKDFNWKAFLVVLIGALALGAVGAAAALLGRDHDHGRWVASAVVASGIFAAAVAVDIVLRDKDWANYVTGALMLLAGLAAYFWLRGSALTVVIVLGGLLVLTQIIEDLVDEGTDSTLGPGIALTVFGIAVVAAGWRFPSRHVTGMLGGAIALTGMLQVTFFGAIFGGLEGVTDSGPDSGSGNGDIWAALIIGLVVSAALAALYAYTDYNGYLVLAFFGALSLVFISLPALQTDNRLWFAVIIGAVGGLLLAAAVLREFLARGSGGRRATTSGGPSGGAGSGPYDPQQGYATDAYGQQPYSGAPGGQTYPTQPPPPPYGGPPPPQ